MQRVASRPYDRSTAVVIGPERRLLAKKCLDDGQFFNGQAALAVGGDACIVRPQPLPGVSDTDRSELYQPVVLMMSSQSRRQRSSAASIFHCCA
jgi:hypothetical protein